MKRRTLLQAGGGLAAASVALATGCDNKTGKAGAASSGTATEAAAGAGAAQTNAAAAAGGAAKGRASQSSWTALGKSLDGKLVRASDAAYATARRLYNTRYDTLKPSAIAYVKHPADIAECLAFARRYDTPVAIRSGGHSYAGWSSGNGKLIVDVSALSKVGAPSGGITRIGAGAKLIDVYEGLGAHGVTIPGGSCPTVGISGLTLGGGHGVVSRAYGLTCDSLVGATLVTADGKTVDCDKKQHSDLFWALRGAGNGNFGVVTELRFRTHPAPRAVMAYMTWPWAKAAKVVASWQKWGPVQADEIWSACHLDARPGNTPSVSIAAFSLGSYRELQNAIDKLADQAGGPGPAKSVHLTPTGYLDAMESYAGCSSKSTAQCHMPGSLPGQTGAGKLGRETYAARSHFFDRSLSTAGIRTLMDQIEACGRKGVNGNVALTALGGAINRVGRTDTAFVHRGSKFLAQYLTSWPANGSPGTRTAWLNSFHDAMRRHSSGAAYQNYTDPGLTDWKSAYYGAAATRLAQVKRTYDPQRLFSTFPQAL
ncbi:FAD-binding oxidoreductase [Streptomyces decoyicus]|uniref:FAD-binding oxidoreductase n=1 Tax=Streptomyces decoyicus TaxID=249567 RepID=UPI0004AA8675|nr:FAD-binding oxidoreductase [Streptomyces decoyicus]KOG49296.1 lipoprotein [Streptomyces decoyicus]QZY17466.1 FAD-binding oxidoreductase [Streptomyces decoyicus]